MKLLIFYQYMQVRKTAFPFPPFPNILAKSVPAPTPDAMLSNGIFHRWSNPLEMPAPSPIFGRGYRHIGVRTDRRSGLSVPMFLYELFHAQVKSFRCRSPVFLPVIPYFDTIFIYSQSLLYLLIVQYEKYLSTMSSHWLNSLRRGTVYGKNWWLFSKTRYKKKGHGEKFLCIFFEDYFLEKDKKEQQVTSYHIVNLTVKRGCTEFSL